MKRTLGTCETVTKDVTIVSLEFCKEENKGRVGKALKKIITTNFPNLARYIDLRFKELSESHAG